MSQAEVKLPPQGRRRGRYSDEFKERLIAACRQPGVSTAAVALANGINANLLRRWVTWAEAEGAGDSVPMIEESIADPAPTEEPRPAFIKLEAPVVTPDTTPVTSTATMRIELHKGDVRLVMDWPVSHITQCVTLLGAVLK